ncbi:hypothetical protein CO083_01280 [Candidatus Roizmanbacteria bacterium CG_4_9_14_0_8_um_filter_34_12]|uniref:Uncharacterized protein n=3 Tax=Candidatus Roizmaniibacteriota TaxID=1752723 RepID=A0A2M8DDS4_9BACT|nr:MAG: hypothetical protein CO083_01280 [Candidatus Roizmanbacteria bacterium CG_4_9_14_0_8_um_filter_34_12]
MAENPLQKRELLVQFPARVIFRKVYGRKPAGGELCFFGLKSMAKNLKRYYQAWELRQQGKTYKKIGEIMGFSKSWAGTMVSFINFKIKYQKQRRISGELKELVKKYPNI